VVRGAEVRARVDGDSAGKSDATLYVGAQPGLAVLVQNPGSSFLALFFNCFLRAAL
jgi:hypothetical protein